MSKPPCWTVFKFEFKSPTFKKLKKLGLNDNDPVVPILRIPLSSKSAVVFELFIKMKVSLDSGPPLAADLLTPKVGLPGSPAKNTDASPLVIGSPAKLKYPEAYTVPSTFNPEDEIPFLNWATAPDWINKLLLYLCIPAIRMMQLG